MHLLTGTRWRAPAVCQAGLLCLGMAGCARESLDMAADQPRARAAAEERAADALSRSRNELLASTGHGEPDEAALAAEPRPRNAVAATFNRWTNQGRKLLRHAPHGTEIEDPFLASDSEDSAGGQPLETATAEMPAEFGQSNALADKSERADGRGRDQLRPMPEPSRHPSNHNLPATEDLAAGTERIRSASREKSLTSLASAPKSRSLPEDDELNAAWPATGSKVELAAHRSRQSAEEPRRQQRRPNPLSDFAADERPEIGGVSARMGGRVTAFATRQAALEQQANESAADDNNLESVIETAAATDADLPFDNGPKADDSLADSTSLVDIELVSAVGGEEEAMSHIPSGSQQREIDVAPQVMPADSPFDTTATEFEATNSLWRPIGRHTTRVAMGDHPKSESQHAAAGNPPAAATAANSEAVIAPPVLAMSGPLVELGPPTSTAPQSALAEFDDAEPVAMQIKPITPPPLSLGDEFDLESAPETLQSPTRSGRAVWYVALLALLSIGLVYVRRRIYRNSSN